LNVRAIGEVREKAANLHHEGVVVCETQPTKESSLLVASAANPLQREWRVRFVKQKAEGQMATFRVHHGESICTSARRYAAKVDEFGL
jgi:hypothetical protein